MAAKKFKLSRLFAIQEPTFATEPDASGATYKHIKVLGDAVWHPTAEVLPRQGLTGQLTRQAHVIGVKGGTLTFKLEMKGSGTPAASTVAAIASESSPLLEALLGSVVRGTGDTVQAGSTASTLTVTLGTHFSVGMAVVIGTAVREMRIVTGIAGNVLTLDRALAAGVPANATVVYASSMFSRSDTGQKSMAFVGQRDGVEYTMLGCIGNFKVSSINSKGTALIDFTFNVADWSVTAKGSLPATDLSGVTAVKGPVVKGSPYAIGAAVPLTEELVYSFELDPGLKTVFQDSTAGSQGKSGFALVETNPLGMVKAYQSAQHLTDFLAGTANTLAIFVGDETNGFAIAAISTQYTGQQLEDHDGIVGENLPFAINDAGVGAEYFISQF